jgi:hypothetical protein
MVISFRLTVDLVDHDKGRIPRLSKVAFAIGLTSGIQNATVNAYQRGGGSRAREVTKRATRAEHLLGGKLLAESNRT